MAPFLQTCVCSIYTPDIIASAEKSIRKNPNDFLVELENVLEISKAKAEIHPIPSSLVQDLKIIYVRIKVTILPREAFNTRNGVTDE